MISAQTLAAVTALLAEDASAARLRLRFPELHFTECSEDDVSPRAKPVAETTDYRLYLVSGAAGHCLSLSNDCDSATGIVVAAKMDDALSS